MCSARYKTRPGLTYHYTHTHKETKECDVPASEGNDGSMDRGSPKQAPPAAAVGAPPPSQAPPPTSAPPHVMPPASMPMPLGGAMDSSGPPGSGQFQDSYLTFLKVPGMLSLNAMRLLDFFFFFKSLIFPVFIFKVRALFFFIYFIKNQKKVEVSHTFKFTVWIFF